MSRINEIKKQNPYFDISIIDTLNLLMKKEKPKYIDLFLNLFKKRIDSKLIQDDYFSYKNELKSFGLEDSDLEGMDDKTIMYHSRMAQNYIPYDEFDNFKNFISLYEKNMIDKKDITAIKSFEEVRELVSVAEIRGWDKEMEQQVKVELDNEETGWLLVRPLTYESSKKYGSATKWCTTQKDNATYFYRYWRNILVYCINRKTGYKVAMHHSVHDRETSFWDAADARIDSMMTELDNECLITLVNTVKEGISNRDLTPLEYVLEEEMWDLKRSDIELRLVEEDQHPVPQIFELPGIGNNTLTLRGDGIDLNTTPGDGVITLNTPYSDWVATLSNDDRILISNNPIPISHNIE